MNRYNKKVLTFDEQIELLISRGLIVPNESETKRHLNSISYYRLSAYMIPFQSSSNQFKKGANWNDVYRLYVFDRELRLLVFRAIEHIEIAVRTQLVYQLSHKYGSHWYDNKDVFKAKKTKKTQSGKVIEIDIYQDIQNHIRAQLNSSHSEMFISHYKERYKLPKNPPSWMGLETMYFSHLSRICVGLNKRSDRSAISDYFGLPPEIFCSWLHSLNYLRNLCAHHARLWNRDLGVRPRELKFSKNLLWHNNQEQLVSNRLYYFLLIINFLLQTIDSQSNFKQEICFLLKTYDDIVDIEMMGFPSDWQEEAMWQ